MTRLANWTPADDERLLAARERGMPWDEIAGLFDNRTTSACRLRALYIADNSHVRARAAEYKRAKRARERDEANDYGVLPFHDPRAAEVGCENLRLAMEHFYARRSLAA